MLIFTHSQPWSGIKKGTAILVIGIHIASHGLLLSFPPALLFGSYITFSPWPFTFDSSIWLDTLTVVLDQTAV